MPLDDQLASTPPKLAPAWKLIYICLFIFYSGLAFLLCVDWTRYDEIEGQPGHYLRRQASMMESIFWSFLVGVGSLLTLRIVAKFIQFLFRLRRS